MGAGLCASLWLLWVMKHAVTSVPADDVAAYYTMAPYFRWWSQEASNPFSVAAVNCLFLLTGTVTVPLPGLGVAVAPHSVWIVLVLGLATWSFVAAGWFQRPALVASLAAYVGLILLWPWPPARFLVPLVPLFTVFFVRGINRSSMSLPRIARNWMLAAMIGGSVLSNLAVLREDIVSTRNSGYPAYPQIKDDLPMWQHFETLFSWIRYNSSSDDVLASGLDSMLFLYADRRSVRPFEPRPTSLFYGDSRAEIGTVEDFVRALREHKVRFFVRLPMHNFSEEEPLDDLLAETALKFPGCLRKAYSVPQDERFVALAVDAPSCAYN
jgi:hypothetical protein